MKAWRGGLTRKAERALNAGCDIVLQCSGALADSVKVAKGSQFLAGRAYRRAMVAEACAEHVTEFDRRDAENEFDMLFAKAAA